MQSVADRKRRVADAGLPQAAGHPVVELRCISNAASQVIGIDLDWL
jgi:hypothetical protein